MTKNQSSLNTPNANLECVKEEIIDSAKDFYEQTKNNKNHRFHSWEYCYYCFSQARKDKDEGKSIDYDKLALNLAFYLASWGMLRNSFLLNNDYKVHIEVVKLLLNDKYKKLFGIQWTDEIDREESIKESIEELNDLYLRIDIVYSDIRNKTKIADSAFLSDQDDDDEIDDVGKEDRVSKTNNISDKIYNNWKCVFCNNFDRNSLKEFTPEDYKTNITETLITKVLLGTLGCIPAFDKYFMNAIGLYNNQNKKLINELARPIYILNQLIVFYCQNKDNFEKFRVGCTYYSIVYPQMKILDMGLWYLEFHFKNQLFNQLFDEKNYRQYGKIKYKNKKGKDIYKQKIFDIININETLGINCQYKPTEQTIDIYIVDKEEIKKIKEITVKKVKKDNKWIIDYNGHTFNLFKDFFSEVRQLCK